MVKVTFNGEGRWAQYPEEKRVYSGGEISVTLRLGESAVVSEVEAERLMKDFPGAFVNADDYHPSTESTSDAPEEPGDPEDEDTKKETETSASSTLGIALGEESEDKPEDE